MSTLREMTTHIDELVITSLQPKPLVVEGTLCGYDFTFRYRCGSANLLVGGGRLDPLYRAAMEYGDEWCSTLEPEEMVQLLTQMVPQLTRATRQWAFPLLDGEGSHVGWGASADEAYDSIVASHRIAGLQPPAIYPVSYTVDDRVYPEVDPDFEACVRPLD